MRTETSFSNLKVGVLAPPWPIPAPKYGGVEAVVDGLCRGLASIGVQVRLWTTSDSTCPIPKSSCLASTDIDPLNPLPQEISHVIHGYNWFLEEGVEIVHDHTLIGPLYGPSRINRPVVSTNHLPFSLSTHHSIYREISKKVAILAISKDQAMRAKDIRVADVIHHGIDVRACEFGTGDGDSEGNFFAFVGRMSIDKGVHLAATVCKKSGLRLLIAARMEEPKEFEYFEKSVKPLLDDRIRFVGELAHKDKYDLLGRATALLNPITWPEPFGLVMIESLACGTPVIALNNGAAPEIIDQGRVGWTCPTVENFADRLNQVKSIDRRVCRDYAEKFFSLERMARNHAALYTRLVENWKMHR